MQVSTLDGWFVATTDDDVAESSAIPHDADLIAHAPTDLADLIAEVERRREEVAEVRAQATADGALMHEWHRESETAADERDELRAQIERVQAVADRWEELPAYRAAARAIREALEGHDDETE